MDVLYVDETETETYSASVQHEGSQTRVAVERSVHRRIPEPTFLALQKEAISTFEDRVHKDIIKELFIVYKKHENASAVESDQEKKARKFLRRIYDLSGLQNENAALDEVIERFEEWLEEGNWWACRTALALADVDKLLPTVSLGILSMTLVEKNRLSASRPIFYRRVWRRLAAQYGEQEANDDLQGLD